MTVHSLDEYRGRRTPSSRSRSGAASSSPLSAAPLCIHSRNEGQCFDCWRDHDIAAHEIHAAELAAALIKLAAVISLIASAILGLVIICGGIS